ncbi:MAG: hypothetical protein M1344_01090 [Candidatus Thermoplasmatota archaeon]|nr:hypothetical protein [Candidatus Thermoplasmatota archaeon]MDA8143045.1 hypothetical protein [Thermoplasmatales archaeon]
MGVIDQIVSLDLRRRKYSVSHILKFLIILQTFRVTYRTVRIPLPSHEEYQN